MIGERLWVAMSLVAACGPAPRPDPGEPDAPADVCATTTCGSGETCCSGACTTDSTCSFALTGLSTSTGYVGGGTYVHLHGTGFAEGMRAFIGDGRAPIRVVSPTEAVIVTPPARAASYDVRVELAGLTSTLPTAFDVASYGFTDAWLTLTMTTPRGNFPAMTTLQDGRVLIAGGMSASTVETILNTAETYDPLTHTTTPVGAMTVPRFATTAITLLDGRALVLGVCNGAGTVGCPNAAQRDIAELFDPVTNTFSVVPGRLHDATRYYVNPVLLPDGRVLVQSTHSNTLEIFDPDDQHVLAVAGRVELLRVRPARPVA